MNIVALVGQLGRDPELQHVGAKQTALCKFSLATKAKERDATGSYVSKTTWHNCVAWGHNAEFVSQYFRKGSWIGVTGKIRVAEWEKDGKKHKTTEIQVDSVEFVGPKDNSPRAVTGGTDFDVPF